MTSKDLTQYINAPESEPLFASLYGKAGVAEACRRYSALIEGLAALNVAGDADLRVFTAAGRTELGGNHTDHNQGKVLAAAIQLDSVAVVSKRNDKAVFFRSTGYPDVELDISDLAARPAEQGATEALVRGIAADFARRGVPVGGFTANADSMVLSGSGLSSSAAVEALLCKIFDKLYGEGTLTALEIARICQKAENEYFGKPCGLMDQCACAFGGAIAVDFADPAAPLVKQINVDFETIGYALCVVNTRGSHADLTADYAAIPEEMKAVARHFGKDVLREVDGTMLAGHAAALRANLGDRAVLRALHFYNENERVDDMRMLLEAVAKMLARLSPDEESPENALILAETRAIIEQRYFELVRRSGASSWELLQNVYSPKNPRTQGISLALALTRGFFDQKKCYGACRVHGGGFAGTIQAYVPLEALEAYRQSMEAVFGAGALTVLRIRPVGVEELVFNGA
ncbi:MAG: galactokinase [Treponema sp.]|jgi:galactokinase|nr:galactokinase [Treponema sp.]